MTSTKIQINLNDQKINVQNDLKHFIIDIWNLPVF